MGIKLILHRPVDHLFGLWNQDFQIPKTCDHGTGGADGRSGPERSLAAGRGGRKESV